LIIAVLIGLAQAQTADTLQIPENYTQEADTSKPKEPAAQPQPKPFKKKDLGKMSYEDLFKAAFKTEIERAHYFMVRFFADGNNFGNVEIFYDSAFTSFDFYSMPFSKYLDTILLSKERPRINGTDGHFNSDILKDLNFEVNLDENIYELHINLPADIKELQILNLSRDSKPRGTLIEPAFFSLYSNFLVTESFGCGDFKNCLRSPVFLYSDAAIAAGGFVLEGSGSFRELRYGQKTRDNLRRGDLRLIKDILSKNTRLTLGDVGEVGGIRLEHSDRIFARDRIMEQHKINFFLAKASYVEVYIDGRLNRRLFLPSGHHQIGGFPGHSGANLVQVLVPQPDGTVQEVKYEFELGEGGIMRKGESRRFLNAGIRRSSVPNPASYKYHPREPGVTAEYAYGLLHDLSVGFSFLASRQNFMTSLLLQNLNYLGSTEFQGSINQGDSLSSVGTRAELRHYCSFEYLSNSGLSLTGYFQNPYYNTALFSSQSVPSAEFAGLYSSISIDLVSVNAGIYFNRKESPNPYDYRYGIAVSQSIFGLSLGASLSAHTNKSESFYYFALNASYGFGIDNHYVTMSNDLGRYSHNTNSQSLENPYYDPEYDDYYDYYEPKYIEIPGYSEHEWSRSTSLGWGWSDGGNYNMGQRYSAGVTSQGDLNTNISKNINANLNAFYYLNRAEIGASHSYSRRESISGKVSQGNFTNARFATSFMFADGLWAFGRPVRGGFILTDVNNSLSGAVVRINYSEEYDSDLSHSGPFGAAYKNSIGPYYYNTMNIRLNDMPLGTYLDQNRYYVMGAYKQGYALRLGNEMRVFMQVRLRDKDGNLSNYYAAFSQIGPDGKVTNAQERRSTFTSKDGILQMGNLIPGSKYRISFDPSTYIKDVDIEIPKDSEPFLDLPDIKVEFRN